jgi:hypothetical protein
MIVGGVDGELAGGVAGGLVVAGVSFAGGVCALTTPARLSNTRAEPPRKNNFFRRINI